MGWLGGRAGKARLGRRLVQGMHLDQQLVVLPKKLRAAEGFTEPLVACLLHAFNFRVFHANQVRN